MVSCVTKGLNMLHFIMFIVITFSQQIVCKNSCKLSNLDDRMRALTKTLGETNAKWPENEDQEMKFCRDWYEAEKNAIFFKRKCYQGISKSLIKFTIHALENNNIKLACKNSEEMRRFLKRGKCGNKAKKGTAKCWSDWVNKLTMIKNVTQTADKVPLMCCSLFEWKKCSIDVYQGLSPKMCSKNSINEFDNYMQHSIVDPMNVIFSCGEYDTKQCDQFSKLISKRRRQKPRYKTPFPVILEIYDSL